MILMDVNVLIEQLLFCKSREGYSRERFIRG